MRLQCLLHLLQHNPHNSLHLNLNLNILNHLLLGPVSRRCHPQINILQKIIQILHLLKMTPNILLRNKLLITTKHQSHPFMQSIRIQPHIYPRWFCVILGD